MAQSYTASIRALNEKGDGDWSEAVAFTPANPPSAPRNLTSSYPEDRGDGYVSLGWLPPANDNGDAVDGYVVEYKHAGESDWRRANAATTFVTVHNLQNGTLYSFRVRAVNRAGESAPSNITTNRPARAPDAPRNVRTEVGDDNVITVSWRPPHFDGGEAITAYFVTYGTVAGQTLGEVRPSPATPTATVAHITAAAGANYRVQVFAVNMVGTSGAANDVAETQVVAAQAGSRVAGAIMNDWGQIISDRLDQGSGAGGDGASFNVLGSQFRFGGAGGGGWRDNNMAEAVAGFLKRHGDNLQKGEFSADGLRNSSFALSFGGAGKGAGAMGGAGGATGGGNLGLWGRATHTEMEETGGDVEWEGKRRGLYLGADTRLNKDVLAGFMFSHNKAESDYTL